MTKRILKKNPLGHIVRENLNDQEVFKHKKNPLGHIVRENLNDQEVIKREINPLGHIAGPPRTGYMTKRLDI